MSNIVDYVLNLKDNLSPTLDQANGHAKALEGTMGGVKNMLGVLGVGFAVFKGVEFIKESVEKFHELEQVTAKVEANLQSTGEMAGMSMADLGTMAKGLSSHVQASRIEIMDMQSQLLTFPAITKDVFEQSMGLVTDIAKQTGHGLSETAIMYGKALNDPVDGLQKMMRYGVMFTDEEKKKITALQESGNLIGAQKMMMDSIAGSGYAGVATAMFNADPLGKFNKIMGSLKMIVGEVAMDLLTGLKPALEFVANSFKAVFMFAKDVIDFFKEHEKIASLLKVAVVSVGAALLLYNTYLFAHTVILKANAIWEAIQLASISIMGDAFLTAGVGAKLYAAAQWAINAAMDANPIGLIIIGIAALIAITYEVIDNFHSWGAAISILMGPFGLLIDIIMSLYDHWSSITEAFKTDGIIGGIKRIGVVLFDAILYPLQQALEWIGKITGADWAKSGAASLKNMREELNLVTDKETGELKKEGAPEQSLTTGAGEGGAKPTTLGKTAETPIKEPKTKAEGAKSVNITVNYQAPLIKDFTISTTNIQEGLNSLKEKVSDILTSATHDAMIVADN